VRVLIGLVASLAMAGCYAPALDDCQFECGANNACPDGLTCSAGYCRSSTAGSCATGGEADGGADTALASTIDSGVACPASPCDGTPVAVGDHCAVVCAPQSFTAATTICASGWRLAIADTGPARAALETAFPGTRAWVGLMKTNGGVSGWQWLTTPRTDQPTDLAAHPPWAAGEPAATGLYGVLDATGATAALATSPGPERAFCESIP